MSHSVHLSESVYMVYAVCTIYRENRECMHAASVPVSVVCLCLCGSVCVCLDLCDKIGAVTYGDVLRCHAS